MILQWQHRLEETPDVLGQSTAIEALKIPNVVDDPSQMRVQLCSSRSESATKPPLPRLIGGRKSLTRTTGRQRSSQERIRHSLEGPGAFAVDCLLDYLAEFVKFSEPNCRFEIETEQDRELSQKIRCYKLSQIVSNSLKLPIKLRHMIPHGHVGLPLFLSVIFDSGHRHLGRCDYEAAE